MTHAGGQVHRPGRERAPATRPHPMALGFSSGRPDRVECALVERKQPAGCDLPVDDVVQADGGPAMVHVADRGEPVGQRGDPVSVADEDIASLHLKCVTGEVSSSSEVVENLLETTVGPGDAVVAGDGPGDVRSKEPLES